MAARGQLIAHEERAQSVRANQFDGRTLRSSNYLHWYAQVPKTPSHEQVLEGLRQVACSFDVTAFEDVHQRLLEDPSAGERSAESMSILVTASSCVASWSSAEPDQG